MTPIEIAAKAAYESAGVHSWEEVHDKARVIAAMRNALLALANQEARPGLISKFHWDTFRAVCRAIANEGKDNG